MSNESRLSGETLERIDALTREISVARELDGEIRAELRAHIEDKIRGYVGGELRPSEADALLLARAHFGNPELVRSLLCEAHDQPDPIMRSLAGRLAWLGAVSLIVYALCELLWLTLGIRFFWYPAMLRAYEQQTALNQWVPSLFRLGWTAMPAAALAVVLAVARIRGHTLEWRPGRRKLGLGVVCFLAVVLPTICYFARQPLLALIVPMNPNVTIESASNLGPALRRSLSMISTGLTVFPLLAWLWWIGPARFRVDVLLATVAAWMLTQLVAAAPMALELAFIRNSWTGQTTPLTPFSRVMSFALPASALVIVMGLLVRKVSMMRGRRLLRAAE